MSEPYDTLRDATGWATTKLGARFDNELLKHVLTQIETNTWINLKDKDGIARPAADTTADIKQLSIEMYRIAHALGLGQRASCARIIQIIGFIQDNLPSKASNHAAVSSIAVSLYQLSDRDYAWLIGTYPSPLSKPRINALIDRLNTENKWHLVHTVGIEVLEKRFIQSDLLKQVTKLYADILALCPSDSMLSYGFGWYYHPTGVKSIVDEVAKQKLVLPDAFPLSDKAKAEATDRTVNRVASILYTHAKERLDAKLYGIRCQQTQDAYIRIFHTLKPEGEEGGASEIKASDAAPTTGR